MNEALALIHFPDSDSAEDVYNEKVFRIKQYYFQNIPLPRVVKQKVAELKTIQEAYDFRFPDRQVPRHPMNSFSMDFVSEFAKDYSKIQEIRAGIRREISKTNHAFDISNYLENWYKAELDYAGIFAPIFEKTDLSSVNLSQSPDAMSVIELIHHLDFTHPEKLPVPVQNELKRCSKLIAFVR